MKVSHTFDNARKQFHSSVSKLSLLSKSHNQNVSDYSSPTVPLHLFDEAPGRVVTCIMKHVRDSGIARKK